MKTPGEPDSLYVGARRVLLGALAALQPHLESLVLVGAQAIYLHCGEADFAVSPYTKDADLLINPETLSSEPDICRAMEAAGFIRGSQPGIWLGGQSVPVDLLVPDSLGGSGRRAARLPGHGRDSARKVRGMEVALVDRAVQGIGSLEESDRREFRIMVAGPGALIVTKLHKLGERIQARDRIQKKDALDIFRMLRGLPTDKLVSAFQLLLEDPLSQPATNEGVGLLSELFLKPDSPGTLLVGDTLEGLEDRTERDTNVGLHLLEALGKEMLAKEGEFRKEYYINSKKTVSDTGEPRELTFVATSRDLLMALQILSRNKGFRLPFSNAQQLGVRLANEADVLGPAGWCWEREKIVHGTRYHRFTKRWSQDL